MPRATECVIGVELANAIGHLVEQMPVKIENGDLGMKCTECGKPVKPHTSKGESAHFEHLKRNPKCTLSDPHRS